MRASGNGSVATSPNGNISSTPFLFLGEGGRWGERAGGGGGAGGEAGGGVESERESSEGRGEEMGRIPPGTACRSNFSQGNHTNP